MLKPLILASSLVLTGCNLSYLSVIPDPAIAQKNDFAKIEDKSRIGRYFLSDWQTTLDKAGVMGELEERLEHSASVYFGRKVEYSTPYLAETGQRIILAKRGELGIIGVQAEPFYQFTPEQKKAAQYYAERKGLPVNDLDEKVSGEPIYAAYVSDLGGFAFSLLLTHVIVMDHDKSSLYNATSIFAHEATHHLIEMAEPYFQLPVIFYSNERMSLVETACDVVSDKVALQFERDHLVLGSKIFQNYNFSRKHSEQAMEKWQTVVEQFKAMPLEKRINERDRIMQEFSAQIGIEVNEAVLSIVDRYSGNRQRYSQMEEIVKVIGPTDFISLVSDVYTDAQLELAHDYVVNKGMRNVERMRDYFRREDTNWPDGF
ncbi:MAG: hypothetical protein AABW48_05920 [Nanoarchaeota archaeon]